MFNQSELDRLLKAMRATGVQQLALEGEGHKLCLGLFSEDAPATHSDQRAPAPSKTPIPAKSEGIGLFVARGNDDGLSALEPLAAVSQGDVLGYVAQDDIRTVIVAPISGMIIDSAPQSGTVIGFGDEVFLIEGDT